MSRIKYSIVIPTRDRHDTVRSTLKTALALDYEDYEIVVQDNSCDGQTKAIVEKLNPKRDNLIKYQRHFDPLPMTLNWRNALDGASGDYIIFLGDDDAIMPDALKWCDALLRTFPQGKVIKFAHHAYYWPTANIKWFRNCAQIQLTMDGAYTLDAKDVLKKFYQWQLSWGDLPLIIGGCVHRSVIDAARKITPSGEYFDTGVPDVHTGIVNAWVTDTIIQSRRATYVGGISGYSSGAGQVYRSWGTERYKKFWDDNKKLGRVLHESMIETPHIAVIIANQMLLAREMYFPHDPQFSFDISRLLYVMAQTINNDSGSYQNTLQDIYALTQKNNIPFSSVTIPDSVPETEKYFPQGPMRDQAGNITGLLCYGDDAGFENIADAVDVIKSISTKI